MAPELRVDLTCVVCQESDQGICWLQQTVWEIPVRSQAGAAPLELTL
ncbi:hypothetical protein NKDENANG_02970 [Candidatus Entotheonellaceae bacterium PAL068K]